MRIISLLLVSVLSLSSCALVEPTARVNAFTRSKLSESVAISCAIITLKDFARTKANWKIEPLKSNLDKGTLETGNFPEANIVGIRVQLEYQPASQQFKGKVKASGIYFSDLGAKEAAKDLSSSLSKC